MPDEFYQSIRHISSFTCRAKYEVYLAERIKEWNEKHTGTGNKDIIVR